MSCLNPTIPAEYVITCLNELSPLVMRAKLLAELSACVDGQPDGLRYTIAILETIGELMGRADQELDRLSDVVTRATAER